MLVLRFCLLLVTFPFTHLLATDDFSSDLDTSLFSSLDDQDLESNGDLLEGYLTDSQGLPPGLHFQEFPPPLNSEDLVPSLYAQDLSLGGEFDEELSSCPEDIDSPSKKLRARNSQCPNIPSGPINLPDLTNLLNSININEVQTDEETQDLPSLSKALQTFCVNSASGPRMVILVCGSVTYPDGVGQRPGYFIVVRNSWLVTFATSQSCSLWDFFCCEYWDPDMPPYKDVIRGTGYNCESVLQRTLNLYPNSLLL